MGAVALAFMLLWASAVRADKVTSKQITPVKDVTGTCSIETKAADKSLTYECEFSNTSNQPVRFVFCAMADLTDAKKTSLFTGDRDFKPVGGTKTFLLKQVGGNNGKLVCEVKDPNGGALSPASVYFGCKEITLQPGDRNQKFPIGSVSGYKLVTQKAGTPDQEVPFDKLKAGDFAVVYTDQVNLTSTPMKKFDPDGTCNGTKGQGNFIEYDTASIREGVRSQWAFRKMSFVDPFIVYQPITPPPAPMPCDANGDGFIDLADIQAIFAARNTVASPGDPRDVDHDGRVTVNDARICTLRLTRQYASYNDPPCVPTGFPAKVAQLPPCPLRNQPAPPATLDLNLFSWYTEIQPLGTRLPAVLDVVTDGDSSGLRLQTSPPLGVPFDILGAVDLYGTLTLCASTSGTVCLTPQIPEGRRLEVTVNVTSIDPDDPSFLENGEFVQDTVPPQVIFHSAQFDAANNLAVTVVAQDATTSPLSAELWFSGDAGVTWDHAPLAPTPDVLEEIPIRTFAGVVGPFLSGQPIRYFIAVEDVVSNVVLFGVGEVIP